MRVCARCMCADAEDSMAAAYEVLGWSRAERLHPDSLDIERLQRLGCTCGEHASTATNVAALVHPSMRSAE